jgi:tRNA 2-thiouridine synthesizing protein C
MSGQQSSRGLLVICRKSAWQASSAAALELAMTAGVFEVPVSLLLLGEAVLQLLPNQQGMPLQLKSVARQLPVLELCGVGEILADAEALARYAIAVESCEVSIHALPPAELADLLARQHNVLVF